MNAELFGSFASGLSTWASDVDMVVTGLAVPDRVTGGYDRGERDAIARMLDRLVRQLKRAGKVDIAKVRRGPRGLLRGSRLVMWIFIISSIDVVVG